VKTSKKRTSKEEELAMITEAVRDYAAKKCLLLACFNEQTAPLNAIIARGGEPTPFLPASYLWRHPDFRLVYTADKINID
jgi:hypothetical protein